MDGSGDKITLSQAVILVLGISFSMNVFFVKGIYDTVKSTEASQQAMEVRMTKMELKLADISDRLINCGRVKRSKAVHATSNELEAL